MTAQNFAGPPTALRASTGDRLILRTAADAAFGALPASGAWTQSQILNVQQLRRLVVEVAYDASALTTTGYAQLIAMLSSAAESTAGTAPAIGDDVWFISGVTDGTVTAGALAAGAIGAGSDFTVTASWGATDYREQVINLKAALANSDKIRMRLSFDVTDAKWFALQIREIGDTTNRGTVSIAVVGGA